MDGGHAILIGVSFGLFVLNVWMARLVRKCNRQQEKVADFFEPVRYDDPSPDTIAGRLAAREYSQQITDED